MLRSILFILAWLAVALGCLGIFLPLLPTTPFLLLAAFLFSKSSPRFHHWLEHHPWFGPVLNDWNEHGAVSLAAKLSATTMVLISLIAMFWMNVPVYARVLACSCLAAVMLFLWTRPSKPKLSKLSSD